MKPVRIQRSRQHKQESPNGLPIVYVGRPGKWGNPYHKISTANQNCVELFTQYIEHRDWLIKEVKKELKGKNLSCWCKLGEPCHADILLEIANK